MPACGGPILPTPTPVPRHTPVSQARLLLLDPPWARCPPLSTGYPTGFEHFKEWKHFYGHDYNKILCASWKCVIQFKPNLVLNHSCDTGRAGHELLHAGWCLAVEPRAGKGTGGALGNQLHAHTW